MAWRRRHDRCVTAEECVIETTVPTGFEAVAAEEVEKIFRTQCATARGKITFQMPTKRVKDILKLGGVDHCRVQILHVPSFGFTMDPEDCLSRLQLLVKKSQWREGLSVCSQFQSFSQRDADFSLPDSMPDDQDLTGICYSSHLPAPHGGHMGKGSLEPNNKHSAMDHTKTALDFQSDHAQAKRTEGVGRDAREDISRDSLDERTEVHAVENVQCKTVSLPNMVSDPLCTEMGNTATAITENSLTTSNSRDSEISRKVQESSLDHESAMTKSQNQVMGGNLPESQQDSIDNVEETHHTSPRKPRFRVTCQRAGEGHCFDSMSVAASFGHSVKTAFGWEVNLTNFDVEIVLRISDDEVSVSLALTPDSLHRRDLVALGVATLRSTIACNMLRMVDIQPGHIVCDPLCGTSSIPIQGALRFPAFQLSGDSNRVAMKKTLHNLDHLNRRQAEQGRGGLMMDALRWNACTLPLRDGVVDAFVSDLPFGKRLGRRTTNLKLYSGVLEEMSRCSKPSARAALLTADVKNMTKVTTLLTLASILQLFLKEYVYC